jgi:hypothetical protein
MARPVKGLGLPLNPDPRSALLQPLFNSHGRPTAYIHEDKLFKYDGQFLGWLEDGEDWHGRYVGEIVGGERLFFRESKADSERPLRETPFALGMPYRPWGVTSCPLPNEFIDLDKEIVR